MRTSILFVDDEPNILDGLRRMLRPHRRDWEMAFADNGPQALSLMQERPFDVIVSDMRMPAMDGAGLLDEVTKRYPHTVRIVLSGQSDREAVLKSVGPAHQYLAKPCDAEALANTIRRALRLRGFLRDEAVRSLVARMRSVPSLPALYTQIMEALKSPDTSIPTISSIISRDAAMTAKILQLVNSAFFGLRGHVASAEQAIFQLGLETVRSLVLTVHVFSAFDATRIRKLGLEELWTHSLRVGAMAKTVAAAQSCESSLLDTCFTSGLLHDLGKLILAANLPEEYAAVRQQARQQRVEQWVAERDRLGATHAEVGAYLVGVWGLPDPIIEALAFHHHPNASNSEGFSPLTAVHVADVLAYRGQPETGLPKPALDAGYLERIGLADRVSGWETMTEDGEPS